MILDAHDIGERSVVHTDVCVIGGGPAGITLARELARGSAEVCVLESGGLGFEADTQELCEAEVEGTLVAAGGGYDHLSRLRALGGATGHWGGVLRPLDSLDFEQRPWVPHSGWPFGAGEVAPYYDRACAICEVPNVTGGDPPPHQPGRPLLLLNDGARVTTQIFQQNILHFGARYRDDLQRSARVRVVLHATVTGLHARQAGSSLDRVAVVSLGGRRFDVRARAYVLAAGGLENPRLLLLSDDVQRSGLGNAHDLVGRYFMEHPHVPIGRVVLFRPEDAVALYATFESDAAFKSRIRGAFRLTDGVQRERRLLNASFGVVPVADPFAGTRAGFRALLGAARTEVQPWLTPPPPADFERWYETYLTQTLLFDSASTVARDLDRLRLAAPEDPARSGGILLARAEQAPNPESRVTLSTARDKLGQRRIKLAWRLGNLDRDSLAESVKILGTELGRAALGRAQIIMTPSGAWPAGGGGFHHMGTTRMHADPRQGVVDANCRVHGVSNLYVAGSSVFPTGGHANPTLTIVALTVRLADHLKRALGL
jgi:choline dehydrogenase-like flavoprotein